MVSLVLNQFIILHCVHKGGRLHRAWDEPQKLKLKVRNFHKRGAFNRSFGVFRLFVGLWTAQKGTHITDLITPLT